MHKTDSVKRVNVPNSTKMNKNTTTAEMHNIENTYICILCEFVTDNLSVITRTVNAHSDRKTFELIS